MKIEYAVVTGGPENHLTKFIDDVNKALSEGWKLQGGVSISDRTTLYSESSGRGGDSDFTIAQALYREVLTDAPQNAQSPASAETPETLVPPTGQDRDNPT